MNRDLPDLKVSVAQVQYSIPSGYRSALQLATLILWVLAQRTSRDRRTGVLLNVSGLWEHAVRRMCGSVGNEHGWKWASSDERTMAWADTETFDDVIVAVQSTCFWGGRVFDGSWTRNINEALATKAELTGSRCGAYALAFDADRVSLVYPTATNAEAPCRCLLQVLIRGKRITVDSLDLPMVHAPEACILRFGIISPKVHSKSCRSGPDSFIKSKTSGISLASAGPTGIKTPSLRRPGVIEGFVNLGHESGQVRRVLTLFQAA